MDPVKVNDGSIARTRVILALLWLIALGCGARVLAVTTVRNAPVSIRDGVDPNRAPWWDLTLLPEVGPATAQAIIALREAREPPAYRSAIDLTRVRGIGPRTVERFGRFLRFDSVNPDESPRVADQTDQHEHSPAAPPDRAP